MLYLIRALIAVAPLSVLNMAAGRAASPYDGVWSGQVAGPSPCAGSTLTLTVTDGSVSGVLKGPMGAASYAPTKVASDGTALLVKTMGINRGGTSMIVTFTDDHFQIHIDGICGSYDLTGSRINQ